MYFREFYNHISQAVNPNPPVPTITAGGPTTFCAGDNVVLTLSAATGNLWSTSETTYPLQKITGWIPLL